MVTIAVNPKQLKEQRFYHQQQIELINKMLQKEEKEVVSTVSPAKGSRPLPADLVTATKNKLKLKTVKK